MGEIVELMLEGEVCAICGMDFDESYGYAKACEGCGGDGVLIGEAEESTPEDNCHAHDRKEYREGR